MTDLTGQKFGKLTVVRFAEKRGKAAVWECQCDCGNTVMAYGTNLTSGQATQCADCRHAAQIIDLTGQRFGKLTVVRMAERRGGRVYWLCRCDCGNETIAAAGNLRSGSVRQCHDCRMKQQGDTRREDLTGQRFGRLTVVSQAENRGRYVMWNCVCDCGNEIVVRASHLQSGATQSCGCLRDEAIAAIGHQAHVDNVFGFVDGTEVTKIVGDKPNVSNTSGVTGVCWSNYHQRWLAYITFKGVRYRLGGSKDFDEAVAWRREAEAQLHGPFLDWYYNEFLPRNQRKKIKHKKRMRDLAGQRFGRLTVVKPTGYANPGNHSALWECVCDCGNKKIASSSDLLYGRVKSCGCMPRGKKKKTEDTP